MQVRDILEEAQGDLQKLGEQQGSNTEAAAKLADLTQQHEALKVPPAALLVCSMSCSQSYGPCTQRAGWASSKSKQLAGTGCSTK